MYAALIALSVLAPQAAGQSQPPKTEKPWKIRITKQEEPGIPMIVTGRVVDQSSRPLTGVKVYVYHTDATGKYQLPGQQGNRLQGTMWTNKEGRFEFRTIRPGLYPGAREGEHFHFTLTEGGISDHFANVMFRELSATKLVVAIGKQGESAKEFTGFAWKPDREINGQRLDVEFKVMR